MHLLWGILIVVAGLFLLVCGTLKSEFIVYRSEYWWLLGTSNWDFAVGEAILNLH